MVSYVFQLKSVDFDAGQVVYVHCIGPYSSSWGPWCGPEELCMVTGMAVAYGSVNKTDGTVLQSVYITARSVCCLSRVDSEGDFIIPRGTT
jgi:hypothetical protein